MLEDLKKKVCDANLRLKDEGLVIRTWGNASGVDRKSGHLVIKPSGLDTNGMKPRHMVVVSLETGEVVEGELNPSSDTPTHLELYRAFNRIGGVVHTHSVYATAYAQVGRDIPPLGTTHADSFYGAIPCTRALRADEIHNNYEACTGKVIAERFASINPSQMQAVLVAQHGPFTWGSSPDDAVENASLLEHMAMLAVLSTSLTPYPKPIPQELQDKHYFRKHGPDATYGQK